MYQPIWQYFQGFNKLDRKKTVLSSFSGHPGSQKSKIKHHFKPMKMLITNGANGPAIFELATSTLQLEVSKTFQWVVIRVPEDWGFYGWWKKNKTPKRRDIHHPVESSCHLHWPGTAKRVTVTAWLKSQAAVAKSSQRILEIGVPLSHHGLNIAHRRNLPRESLFHQHHHGLDVGCSNPYRYVKSNHFWWIFAGEKAETWQIWKIQVCKCIYYT